MSIDLSQFHQVFYEESFEGLDVMEAALLTLDPNNIDSETINAIFRSAHSIKGGGATFGFTSLSEFTHDLETILDQVRSGKRQFTAEDINICLKSVDCMREMLQLLQEGEDGHTALSQELKAQFTQMLSDDGKEQINAPKMSVENGSARQSEKNPEPKKARWRIFFAPAEDVLRTGNDVVRMFQELKSLGHIAKTDCTSKIPFFHSFDPESCYLSWEIIFETELAKDRIEEVFEWVADEATLSIEKEIVDQNIAVENTAEVNEAISNVPASNMDASRKESSRKDSSNNAPVDNELDQVKCWSIYFSPGEDLLRTGNEPTRLFAALKDYGSLAVEAMDDNLPSLQLLDHEQCHLRWHLCLSSDSVTKEKIEEVFEWVVDDCDLHIAMEEKASLSTQSIEFQDDKSHLKAAELPQQASASNISSSRMDGHTGSSVNADRSTTPQAAKNPGKKKSTEAGSIRVGIDKVDNLINMVGELVITQSMLGQLGSGFDMDRIPKLMEGLSQLEQNTRELQESVMRIRMLPISFAFSRFPRMVRDLEQSLGKKLHLEMLGEQTELDKTVMEKINDPLVHLVRNAIDHGIETPEERERKAKPITGTITLNAYHQGGNVVIEIADDGKGLDKDYLIEKAIEKGVLSDADAENFSEEQAFDLIFQPGFSTANVVSDVSGRGVGMDVVKRNIQALNGTVDIQSKKDIGSKITIRLPLTLAILDGQLVRVGSNTYIFPLVSIVESLQCRVDFISKVAGGCSVFKLRDDYVPIIELYKTFSVTPDTTDLDQSLMVVVESDGEKVGIVVDELLAQQQVVIKSLEQNYKRIDGISGATILGDGTVALILDIAGIVKLAGEKFNVVHREVSRKHLDVYPVDVRATG